MCHSINKSGSISHYTKSVIRDGSVRHFKLCKTLHTINAAQTRHYYQRSISAPTLEAVISDKIKQLQPYLQDNDDAEEFGQDDAEKGFSPRSHNLMIDHIKGINKTPESFETNIRKYKKIKKKIKSALKREPVSYKTKRIITEALDELLLTLTQIQHQNGFVSNKDLKKTSRLGLNYLEDLQNITYDSKKACYINGMRNSNEECKKLIQILTKTIADALSEPYRKSPLRSGKYIDKLFDDSRHNILDKIQKNYNLRCSFADEENKKIKNDFRSKDYCKFSRVCSVELQEFLNEFYLSLNNTVVQVLRNYANTYERNLVNNKTMENNAVIATIDHVADNAQERTYNAFVKLLGEHNLQESKDKKINTNALLEFVRQTVKTVNITVYNYLGSDISTRRSKLLQSIRDDLLENLALDLNHFESEVIKQICSFFMTCKGNPAKVSFRISPNLSRKQFTITRMKSNIIVKTKSGLDNDLKKPPIKNVSTQLKSKKIIEIRSKINENSSEKVVTKSTTMVTPRIRDEVKSTTKIMKTTTVQNTESSENEELDAESLIISKK